MLEIFKIPHLAMRRTVDFLDPVDLLELSLCSKKSANLIKSLRILSLNSDVYISESTASFTIFLANGTSFRWNFWHNYSNEIWEKSISRFGRKIGNVEFETCTKTFKSMHTAFENFESGIFAVSQHLLSIFPGSQIRNCSLDTNSIRSINGFFERNTEFRNISKVSFYGKKALTTDEIRRLIANGVRALVIQLLPKLEYPDEIFQLEKLHLRYGFESSDYLKLKCARLTITFADQLITTDFNVLLKNWRKEGNQSKIRKWELHNVFGKVMERTTQNEERTIVQIFEGIERIEWTPELRKRYYRINATKLLDCRNGVNFLSHDGLLATVTFTWNTLYFVVWENRFPELKPPPGMYYRKDSKNLIKARYHFITTDEEEWEDHMRRIIDLQ